MYGFGQAWAEVTQEQGYTQTDAGILVNISNSHVSKIMSGQRKAPKDVKRAALLGHDDPRIQFGMFYEDTGGAYPVWMNNVNLTPAAVALKTIEELEELIEAIKKAPLHKLPGTLTAEDDALIDRLLEESREAAHASLTLKGVICITYKKSWIKNWIGHNLQLIAKKYFLK